MLRKYYNIEKRVAIYLSTTLLNVEYGNYSLLDCLPYNIDSGDTAT